MNSLSEDIRISNVFIIVKFKALIVMIRKVNITGDVMSSRLLFRNLTTNPHGITFQKTVMTFLVRDFKIEPVCYDHKRDYFI